MQISYNKLLKLMIDNQMKRTDLVRATQISTSTASKLFKNEPVCWTPTYLLIIYSN